ncbi:glycerophosphodiester phosphodiesterase family protein [Paraburkholderia ferrariae]|uniref:Glycerophosphodiester phosphodiesterase family protein n=1 Tax=Paraburkholderia ferrariae TaxID=386056 RepID=A0ABU9S1I7_9BURK
MNIKIFAISMIMAFAPVAARADTPLPVIPSSYVVDKITQRMFEPSSTSSDLVLLSAHRGYWEIYPENSSYALQDAWNRGYETVEIDARFTADKQVIVAHDFNIDRISTGSGAVSSLTYSQLKQVDLKDRHGKVFSDANGNKGKFLGFSEVLDLLEQYVTSDGLGYVVIVDIKTAPGGSGLEIMQKLLDLIAAKNNPSLSKAVVIKINARDAVDLGSVLSRTTYNPNVNGGLVLVENPDADNVKISNYDPNQDVNYGQWNTAPFPIQFEMNQYYRDDGLENYFHYADQQKGFATYIESNLFPEGVATAAGMCCVAHITDPKSTASAPIIPDYRGDPEMAVINPTNLITTDSVDAVGDMLQALGRRNINLLKR